MKSHSCALATFLAQWNLILAHLQHSLRSEISFLRTCNIPNLISRSPVETFHWLCDYMVVKLHAHWHKYLLNVKFSYREHCWWPTSQACVNTLKNETNVKYEATTLWNCYSFRRATQNMSAIYNSPTIGLNLRGLPLSEVSLAALPAKMSAFSSHMRQNAYHHNLKCIFEDLLPCNCYATKANSRTICSRVSQSASAGKEADLVNCKLITACYQNSEPDSCAVWVSYRQTNCQCKN